MIDESVTDSHLCAKIKAGELECLAKLIDRYEARLRRYLNFILQSEATVDDALQNTFIKVYRNIHQFNDQYQFSSWVYRIAHNEALNLVRKNRHFLTAGESEQVFYYIQARENVEADFFKKEDLESLAAALNELPLKYKTPLLLFYYEDKSYEEISDILQLNKSSVGVRIKRAKEKLRSILKKLEEEEKKEAKYE